MRALLAIFLYAAAAVGGLAAGYYATAPHGLGDRARVREERRAYDDATRREFAEMEAAAGFLAEEERRAESRVAGARATAAPARAGL
jgi:hypothetical protein